MIASCENGVPDCVSPLAKSAQSAAKLECDRLEELIETADRGAVLTWFDVHYPRCMASVPPRRRRAYLDGVYDRAMVCGAEPRDA
jgi:hypothetical protein